MLTFVLRRLAVSCLLLFLVLSATFFFVRLAPGEPTALYQNPRMSEEQRQNMRRIFGLDQPLVTQYLEWMGAMVTGDWGVSFSQGRPAADILLEKMPNTCLLVVGILVVEYSLGLLLGMWAAARAGGWADRGIRAFALTFWAMPVFWLALLSIELFTVQWRIFPTNQMTSAGAAGWPLAARILDVLHHLALPALVTGVVRSGAISRFVRNGVLEVLQQDYMRTARAKGLGPVRVFWIHGLRNALIPLTQRFGLALSSLLSGSVVVEVIFSWPGVGLTFFRAMMQRDYPVILAGTALTATLVILGNLVADLLHAWLDPRVRHA